MTDVMTLVYDEGMTTTGNGDHAHTDADVQAALLALRPLPRGIDDREAMGTVLDAVAPAIAARALREAAEFEEVNEIEGSAIRNNYGVAVLWLHQPRQVSEWLRARADTIEAGR